MPSVISGDANVSATEFGYLDGVTSALQTQMDAKAPLASPTFTGTPELPDGTTLAGSLLTSGKILQVVRATDTTNRSTTSTSFVDASISVTITPQKSDSAILLIWTKTVRFPSGQYAVFAITDASNNAISGAQEDAAGSTTAIASSSFTIPSLGYSTPATTSATTYKGRFQSSGGGTVSLFNAAAIGQMFAIEVSA